jgi:hypothetical protein
MKKTTRTTLEAEAGLDPLSLFTNADGTDVADVPPPPASTTSPVSEGFGGRGGDPAAQHQYQHQHPHQHLHPQHAAAEEAAEAPLELLTGEKLLMQLPRCALEVGIEDNLEMAAFRVRIPRLSIDRGGGHRHRRLRHDARSRGWAAR